MCYVSYLFSFSKNCCNGTGLVFRPATKESACTKEREKKRERETERVRERAKECFLRVRWAETTQFVPLPFDLSFLPSSVFVCTTKSP